MRSAGVLSFLMIMLLSPLVHARDGGHASDEAKAKLHRAMKKRKRATAVTQTDEAGLRQLWLQRQLGLSLNPLIKLRFGKK